MESLLPNKQQLLKNFFLCRNWEEKYLYIIELGNYLPSFPLSMRIPDNLIMGCQSQVWIIMMITAGTSGVVQLYGDSDAAIVKGLIAIVFILYNGLSATELSILDVRPFFNSIELGRHLTSSRLQGIEAMIRTIRAQAIQHIKTHHYNM
ncbi:cysteine desulfuration protein SufE [Candidatus Curculioniphilus buchneri]|uniref:cysteine desulfuration protein SufE n=1 Tax=Candidatus Curculioniphilus buchneri TaxID=690594 RepID=UPI00376EDFC9